MYVFPPAARVWIIPETARKVNAFLPAVTHFYASDVGRQKMADSAIDEILALNTLPAVLNRDEQGGACAGKWSC